MPVNCSACDASGHNAARSASHAPSELPVGAVICTTPSGELEPQRTGASQARPAYGAHQDRLMDAADVFPCRTPSADLALKMNLREPQERENEAPDAKPEHNDNHLTKPKVPRSVGKVCGDRCHQVNVADNRQRKQRQHKSGAEISRDPRTQDREPHDFRDEERAKPGTPPQKCGSFRSETHSREL